MATASLIRSEEPLDTTVRMATPERIVFQYPLAGPFRRFMAYLLDLALLILVGLLATLVAFAVTFGSIAAMGPAQVVYFVLTWGYGAFCEGAFNGQTLGKRILSVRVISDQGVPITAAQAILRNLVGALDGLVPFFFLPGLTSMLLSRKFQRLGDLAAGTMVVVELRPRRVGVVRVKEKSVEEILTRLPLRIEAGPEMARALSDYVQHRARLGPSVREEMAEPLARPLRAIHRIPEDYSNDAVLCAVHHRVFVGE